MVGWGDARHEMSFQGSRTRRSGKIVDSVVNRRGDDEGRKGYALLLGILSVCETGYKKEGGQQCEFR
jgi:hypothetical protein